MLYVRLPLISYCCVGPKQAFRSFEGPWRTLRVYEAVRKGQVRWLPKGVQAGQVAFIRVILGIRAA